MKKSLLMMGVAIAALSSCTQSEVLDVASQGKIGFGNSYIGKSTRAAQIIENDAFNSFYAYGQKYVNVQQSDQWVEVFNPVNVYKGATTATGEAAWGYDNLVDFDATAKCYSFAAYSDGGILGKGSGLLTGATATFTPGTGGTTTPNDATLTINNYTTADNKDLVVSFSRNTLTAENSTVDFRFKHALAQVKFTIMSAMGINKVDITEFNVENFLEGGNLIYTKGTSHETDNISWSNVGNGTSQKKAINALDEGMNVATTDKPACGTYVVIPQEFPAGGINVTLKAVLYKEDGNGGTTPVERELKATIQNGTGENEIDFQAGYIYNFIATLDGSDFGVITFNNPTVEEWENKDINFDPNKQ